MIAIGKVCYLLDAEYRRIPDRSYGWELGNGLELALLQVGHEVAWMEVRRVSNSQSVRWLYRTDPDWGDEDWMMRWVRESMILGAV